MADVAVVTACLGGYDEPRPQEKQEGYEDVDWHYFTDDLPADVPEPWQGAGVIPPSVINPRLLAKHWKLTPWDAIIGGGDYRWIVWIDANMEVTSPTFLSEAIETARTWPTDVREWPDGAPVTAWRHPRRTSSAAEIEASLTEAPAKYGSMADELRAQGTAYAEDGFPDDLGLWACGTLVWNMEHRLTRAFGARWLAQCERWTIQDQVSFPFVAWKLGVTPGTFPVPQIEQAPRSAQASRYVRPPYLENRWLRIWPHNRDD